MNQVVSVSVAKDISADLRARVDAVARSMGTADTRAQAIAAANLIEAARAIGREITGEASARQAILDYLHDNVGVPVLGAELSAVSGINEYGRRVRELRAEGWAVLCHTATPTRSERTQLRNHGVEGLMPGEYILLSAHRRRNRNRVKVA